ncbi:MAG: tetratricopeptide repeat protein [Saprospiraceae bacterium]|nr:tetratricopeptide repeat protein [Saprospiraceae bacterium]
MKRFLTLLLLCSVTLLAGQEARLAQQYFRDGEYEKAAVLYEKLFQENERNDYYFDRYVESLLAMEDYETSEKVIKRQLRKEPGDVRLYVVYGKVFERQYMEEEAMEQYRKAIDNLPKERFSVIRLANSFIGLTKYDMAIETYEKGTQLLKDDYIFSYNLGDLYRRKGETPQMIENYLNSLEANPGRLNNIMTIFQRYLQGEEDFRELQKQLYTRIQDKNDAVFYPELLTWTFVQLKDYRNAFRQVKALDRRLRENGARVFQLAEIAGNDKAYDAAIEAYDYIVEEKGPTSSFYLDAKREALQLRRDKITEGYDYTEEDLRELESMYISFLDEFGRSQLTAGIILELAKLEALYLNDLDEAIRLLSRMIEFPGIDLRIQAHGKLSLADFYLMKGEIWEATLLYSQVDKAFKEDILGHEARYRNARLSYYAGDFQWAQAQFDVLKASTSKLIANDALDLSIFIMDNMGLDTTTLALEAYAQADLLVFQNKFEEAFDQLDQLLTQFPEHSLLDDVLYLKSKIFTKKREYRKAADALQRIIDNHSEEIRADNALYELAELYEKHLGDIEKAMQLYETLFIDYSGSTLAVIGRKNYRRLRGDDVQ